MSANGQNPGKTQAAVYKSTYGHSEQKSQPYKNVKLPNVKAMVLAISGAYPMYKSYV